MEFVFSEKEKNIGDKTNSNYVRIVNNTEEDYLILMVLLN